MTATFAPAKVEVEAAREKAIFVRWSCVRGACAVMPASDAVPVRVVSFFAEG